MTARALVGLSGRARGTLLGLNLSNLRTVDFDAFDDGTDPRYGDLIRAHFKVKERDPITFSSLLAVVRQNASHLEYLNVKRLFAGKFSLPRPEALLVAGPELQELKATVKLTGAEAQRVRSEEVFRTLQFMKLKLSYDPAWPEQNPMGVEEAAFFQHLCTIDNLTDGDEFESLRIENACLDSAAAVDALCSFVDSVGGVHIKLELKNCRLAPLTLVPALTRILAVASPTALLINCSDRPVHLLTNVVLAQQLADALCRETDWMSLQRLCLRGIGLWLLPETGTALLRALTAHPLILDCDISDNPVAVEQQTNVGAVLSVFLSSTPTLKGLSVQNCGLGDVGLAALLEAVGNHSALRWLGVSGNGMSRALADYQLLCAAEKCASLLYLSAHDDGADRIYAEGFVGGRRAEKARAETERRALSLEKHDDEEQAAPLAHAAQAA